jgi:CrcB protein
VIYLWVALGAAIGGVARYWCSGVAARLGAELFPWGTLFINVSGSALIGFLFTFTGPEGRLLVRPETRMFLMTGFCGGYTTFSTFSLETLRLIQDRQWSYAAWNVLGSVFLCLAGVWLGHQIAAALNQR